jgi:cytochrome c peroxidase
VFFDKGGCARCHRGPRLTDWEYHNLAVPQIGPGFGTGAAETPVSDKGRFEVTRNEADLHAFRTPSLWEVRATAPYFHNGVFQSLERTIRHHLDAAGSAQSFRCASDAPLVSPGVQVACRDSQSAPGLYVDMTTRLAAEMKAPITLTDEDIADLVTFLDQLANGGNGAP